MSNRITDDTVVGAIQSGTSLTLSIAKFVLFCINDEHQENQSFLTSRGCDVNKLSKVLAAQVAKEEPELLAHEQFARMLGGNNASSVALTPSFKKVIEDTKKTASKDSRDMYFEDFINSLYSITNNKDSQTIYNLDLSGYKHNPNAGIKSKGKYKELYKLCEDLNEKAKAKKIDPLIGRREEVQRMVEILAHYKKKNPCLIGPPGVGKTQVVLGLASLIESGQVPEALKNVKIFSLEVSKLIGGTKFRGDFEQRLQDLLDDIKKMTDEGIIQPVLFIDEIHQAIGAGSAGQGQGAPDMSNIIKPMLASGELSLIGSTTDAEYKQHIAKDKAFARRLQQVKIEEPSAAETLRILEQGIKPVLEKYHNVKFPKAVLERAVELSGKYITTQFFPDKAISLIDSVGARLRTDDASTRKTANISDVEEIVSKITGTPVSAFKKKTGKNAYIDLEKIIKTELYGQEDAIDKIVESYELSKAGLGDEGQPIGSWLLLGPTGTGKTELAKLMAKHTESHFMTINMGEYGEKHSAAKLFGAPPGYEGHKDGGLLTNEITKYPHTVLLLDEIEKAHEKVREALLGILDGGNMTDGEGNKVDFRNVLILMTSNAGAAGASKIKAPVGLNSSVEAKEVIKKEFKNEAINTLFAPEFRNKLSGMVNFNSLDKTIIDKITDKFVNQSINKLFTKKNFTLIVGKDVKEFISKEGYDPLMGARPIARTVKKYIDLPLVKPILKGEIKELSTVTFKMVDGIPKFEVAKPKVEVQEEVVVGEV
ncbi:ATP-dependent Clp protease ATP-binding subunit [uncultured Caudovirales phage]|uniref:ATP-dependent Clp protease ATP-binding subunit n=1 Tax=uncultured Caudovirales phage TaxID=2100421 RepID=A0A6J5KVP6_9CAUD|nr:ATP-dependent Clp protease ATP-binding subunit [uncultured Caudovirales phage]